MRPRRVRPNRGVQRELGTVFSEHDLRWADANIRQIFQIATAVLGVFAHRINQPASGSGADRQRLSLVRVERDFLGKAKRISDRRSR